MPIYKVSDNTISNFIAAEYQDQAIEFATQVLGFDQSTLEIELAHELTDNDHVYINDGSL
jgi:hypothetical protein